MGVVRMEDFFKMKNKPSLGVLKCTAAAVGSFATDMITSQRAAHLHDSPGDLASCSDLQKPLLSDPIKNILTLKSESSKTKAVNNNRNLWNLGLILLLFVAGGFVAGCVKDLLKSKDDELAKLKEEHKNAAIEEEQLKELVQNLKKYEAKCKEHGEGSNQNEEHISSSSSN